MCLRRGLIRYFNPRPPWGGRLPFDFVLSDKRSHFNPRPPWGGRPSPSARRGGAVHFNPRPPWGGRRISIRTSKVIPAFQSTPSVGRATIQHLLSAHVSAISIHALRGEGDPLQLTAKRTPEDFNPRPPWGGRRFDPSNCISLCKISIHALRGEGDNRAFGGWEPRRYFNPRPPWGGRLFIPCRRSAAPYISIHALRGEGDDRSAKLHLHTEYFNPRPPWGGRPQGHLWAGCHICISIHALRGEGDCKNIQIYNIAFVHSVYKIIYFCDSCAFYLT